MVYPFHTGTNGKGEKHGVGFQFFTHGEKGDCADCHVPQLAIDEHKQGREVDLGIAMREKPDHGISRNHCHSICLDRGVHFIRDRAFALPVVAGEKAV